MSALPAKGVVTELRARGYAVLPTPRCVELGGGGVRLGGDWRLEAADVPVDGVAVRTLLDGLRDEHGLQLRGGRRGKAIRLAIRPGAVETGTGDPRDQQAYRLEVAADRIELVGNAAAGLFYGVHTLLQLLEGDGRHRLLLPEGTITDWPEYQLRFVHWDTKHHQDRLETLKRFLDWMARFKLNMVSFELEDKFEYPTHPIIGAPGAFTTRQMQKLVRYGLERHIQIVPNVQAPAHMCYVLKHEEFAHLRCDGSNYQICMDEPEARKLIFDMYDDLCQATQGVDLFHVSTDEVYYAGICEKYRKPYNPTNRSLTWVDFVQAAHEHLSKNGRRIIIWVEYPVLAEHVEMLPPGIIDGILSPGKDPAMVAACDARGIRQLAYCPIQGEEKLFPNYFSHVGRDGRRQPGRLADTVEVTCRPSGAGGNPIGTFVAGWDDAGLHNETFWLGWAAMAQGGWAPGAAPIEQTVAEFTEIFYGRGVSDMVELYRRMQDQARFWESSWDRRPSRVRGPGYGYSGGKRPVTRSDWTLLPPALPDPRDLACQPAWQGRYERLLAEAPARLRENDQLLAGLHASLVRAERNRYNLEVFLSLAQFIRSHVEMLLGVAEAEALLGRAAEAEKAPQPRQAVGMMVAAHAKVGGVMEGACDAYRSLEKVWEKSRLPKNAPAGGREFLHVMDDVKDHFADRRADLSYHIAPFESIGLDKWREALGEVIRSYAAAHGLAVAGLADAPMDD